jgi:predicted dehydrogenase
VHRLAVIGAGGFAAFAVDNFLQTGALHLIAVSDVDERRALALASAHGASVRSVEGIMDDDSIDVVYIATPPSSHGPLTKLALLANKHVLCEKPLATTLDEANEIVQLAGQRHRFAVANLLQRYNPLAHSVQEVIKHQVLGQPLYASIENNASDEQLPLGHWFWDPELSGGIFVEHAVHFFDLCSFWFGSGEVVAASRVLRPSSGVEEQVRCTVSYSSASDAPLFVDSYHGFDQPSCLDRMRTRIVCERGDLTLAGWIPTAVEIDALVDESGEETLRDLFSPYEVSTRARFDETHQIFGRHKRIATDRRITLKAGVESEKMSRYGELVRALLADQLAWAKDLTHCRQLTESDSREAVRVAVAATSLARSADQSNGYAQGR